ncbi:unnamed protein product [Caenorhabditis angaria]|uniref:G-protein coupled receptors family 1 profile domain-containing protein n=1 Tax=Caenorhabditis angaria TaxID=860376 RepID=A0A9P1J552_9PELO|nr:unnamed protein product [Caenorhabditis angaria]
MGFWSLFKASEDDVSANQTYAPEVSLASTHSTVTTAQTHGAKHGVEFSFDGIALLILPVLCLIGLIGNFLVCVAIATDRRLHNVTNYFLFSLALADLLVCCIVMPLTIVVEVKDGIWTWSVSMCLLYVYCDVFLCSASIVHMSVISLDRYLGISQPLRTRNKSKTLIFVKIAIVWIVTLLVSCPIAILAWEDETNILKDNECNITNKAYMLYGSTTTFLIPFCIMAITYIRTTQLLNKQASILSKKANDKLNGNGLRRTMPHRKLGSCERKHHTDSSYDGNNRLGTSRPSLNGHRTLEKASTINRWRSRTSNYLTNIASKVGRRNSLQAANQDLANEHKATRVLAVVFMCFFICWTPFFIANFIRGFSGIESPKWCGSLFLWLGYFSSTINPIIYTVFNKRFRQAFVRILRCQCFSPYRDSHAMYSRNYTTTIVPDTYTWSNHDRVAAGQEMKNGKLLRTHDQIMGKRSLRSEHKSVESSKKTSLPTYAPRVHQSHQRDTSRATTEETNTTSSATTTTTEEESKPLLSTSTRNISKSFSTIISPLVDGVTTPKISSSVPSTVTHSKKTSVISTSLANSVTNSPKPSIRSVSCVDCEKGNLILTARSPPDPMTSSTSSANCPKHFTLFSNIEGGIKETFL